jgi:hypothetical protein
MFNKRSHARKLIVGILLCFSSLLVSQAAAQSSAKKRSVEKKDSIGSCKVGDVAFRCPKYYSKPQTLNPDTVVFRHNEQGSVTYLFVAVPASPADPDSMVQAWATQIVSILAPQRKSEWAWKEISLPSLMDVPSKYATKVKNLQAFDGKGRAFLVSRQFTFEGRSFFLGYGYLGEEESSGEARSLFEKNLGGDSSMGCLGLASVVYSITKEKLGQNEFPCTLTGLSPLTN